MDTQEQYEKADQQVQKLVDATINKNVTELAYAKILTVFVYKPIKKKGRYISAEIKKANVFSHFLTTLERGSNGYDYFLLVDGALWNVIGDEDRERVIRHSLRYADVDMTRDNCYKIKGAEIETFHREIDIEKGRDPQWMQRIEELLISVHKPEFEDGETKAENGY